MFGLLTPSQIVIVSRASGDPFVIESKLVRAVFVGSVGDTLAWFDDGANILRLENLNTGTGGSISVNVP